MVCVNGIKYMNILTYINCVAIADEPQKDELNTCVKKISRNIYALLEAQKSTTEK